MKNPIQTDDFQRLYPMMAKTTINSIKVKPRCCGVRMRFLLAMRLDSRNGRGHRGSSGDAEFSKLKTTPQKTKARICGPCFLFSIPASGRLQGWTSLELCFQELAQLRGVACHHETALFHDGEFGVRRVGTARDQGTGVAHALARRRGEIGRAHV